MSRFTDLFQETVTTPEQVSESVKVEEIVVEKPVEKSISSTKTTKRKFTLD